MRSPVAGKSALAPWPAFAVRRSVDISIRRLWTTATIRSIAEPRMQPHTDSAAARLHRQRGTRSGTPAAVRQRRSRARRKNNQHVYKLVVSDRAIENLIVQFILAGTLSESEAMQPRHVERALTDLLEEMGRG